MASKFPATDDFDEQFLTCSVCMLHFRDPKILPCLHTFCRGCLYDWASKQQPLECPTCRTQVSLPDQGVDGLRTNFYVNNLLDFAAAKEGAETGVPCQVCEGGQDGVKSWCTDCAVLLCESCTKMHYKVPGTRDHEIVTSEVMKAMEGVDKFQRKRHCHKHKNQELVFYCESCKTLVCTACTVIDHRPGKDHNPVEIATVAQKKKESLQVLLQDIDPRLKKIQASVKEVERKLANLTPSKEAATDQAKEYFRQLADLLRKREKKILSQIDEQCRADGKALQTKKEAIEFELAGLTSAQTFCQQTVEHGSDVHILEVGNQVQTRVETLLAKELDLESDWSEFQFVENTAVTDFEKEVQDMGGVKINIDDSKYEIVVTSAVHGVEYIAEQTTMNQEGRACVTNSKSVTANMKDLKRSTEQLGTAQKEKQRKVNERNTLNETNEELHCMQPQQGSIASIGDNVESPVGSPIQQVVPPEIKEKLIRLQHENKMLKLKAEGPDDERLAVYQAMLDDANARTNELETENRLANQRILELQGQLKDMQTEQEEAVEDQHSVALRKKLEEHMEKLKDADSHLQKQKEYNENLQPEVYATAEKIQQLQEMLDEKDDDMEAMEKRYRCYLQKAKSVIRLLDPEALKNQLTEKERLIDHLERDHEKAKVTREREEKLIVSAWYNMGAQLNRKATEARLLCWKTAGASRRTTVSTTHPDDASGDVLP